MEKQQQIQLMWIIGIILIGILLFRYNQNFLIFDNSYPYSATTNYNSIPIIFQSDNPYGVTTQSCDPNGQGAVDNTKDNKFFNNSLKIDFSSSIPKVIGGGNLCGNGNSNNLLIIDKEFKLEDLEKIIIKYTGSSAFSGYDQDYCRMGNTDIKLYLSNTAKDILIYNKHYLWDAQNNPIGGEIDLYKNTNTGIYYKDVDSIQTLIATNFNESEEFKITVFTNTDSGACSSSGSLSISQKFEITNLTFIYKNISTCYPKTCNELDKECGLQDNGCGTIITCGQCGNTSYCNNNGQCNLIPLSCSSQGKCANANGTCIVCPQLNCSDWGLCTDTVGNCMTCGNDTDKNDTACTQEAKTCSDGSYVSRNSTLNCEFNACPKEKVTNWTWPIIGVIALIIGVIVYFVRKKK